MREIKLPRVLWDREIWSQESTIYDWTMAESSVMCSCGHRAASHSFTEFSPTNACSFSGGSDCQCQAFSAFEVIVKLARENFFPEKENNPEWYGISTGDAQSF